ncbi:hypothetical protein ACJIZ3_010482 [Penstemon smallii]|uniref:Uncharacterized protein n=1 Tax=Penstemon smallii TaxID=265156 RepID=A0ABD3TFH2_9LAMI
MVERFFLTPPRQLLEQPDPIILLSGPPSSGKTSLLFQFAFNSAVESGGTVVILCNRRRLETNPPFLSQGVDPSSETFQRIQIKYVDDDEGIKNYFAAFHFHLHDSSFPVSVIIDDFADFFDQRNCQERYSNPRGRDLAMVRVLALCRNAIDHANNNSKQPGGGCTLVFSDTHKGKAADSPMLLLYIYKRWVSSIYTTTQGHEYDGSGSSSSSSSFILRKIYSSDTSTSTSTVKMMMRSAAKYSIATQYLVLEGITTHGYEN